MTHGTEAILYVNGLGDGAPRASERILAHQVAKHAVGFEFLNVNWRDGSSYESWLDTGSKLLENMMGHYGSVAVWGSSAGASLGLLMFAECDDPGVSYVNLRGRLRAGKLQRHDWRTLGWAAHVGTKSQSLSFEESVIRSGVVSESLSNAMLGRARMYVPLFDELVPKQCVGIVGAENISMPVVGHKLAWLYAVQQELNRLP